MNPSKETQQDCLLTNSDIESNPKLTKYERTFNASDITEILDKTDSDDHRDIIEWINENKLCLYSQAEEKNDKGMVINRSLMKILLEEAGDGHEVVEKVLDSYISSSSSNPSSNTYSIGMDFTGIMFENEKGHQDSVIEDLVDLILKCQERFWEPYLPRKGKKENCAKTFRGRF